MANQKNRTQLQNLFKSGAKPSEADFKDLIDGTLNISDDGIEKPAGADTPLKISTHGEQENVLDFYAGSTPTWRLNQKPTADTQGLNLETGGSSKLFIDSSTGNLGLSITKPIAKLHIQQTGSQNALRIDDEVGDTTPLVVNAEGNVGIGTDKPNAKLDVNGDTAIAGSLSITQTSTLTGNVGIGTAPTTTEKLTVKGNTAIAGNMGIGITNPEKKFHVEKGELKIRAGHNNSSADIGAFYSENLSQGIGIGHNRIEAIGANDNQDINLIPKGMGKLSVAGNLAITKTLSVTQTSTLTGNVGIGTAPTNSEKLKVNGNAAIAGDLSVTGNIQASGTIAGFIASNGKIVGGSGFTAKKVGTGLYDVKFKRPFSNRPAVIATQHHTSDSGNTRDNAVVTKISNDSCRIHTGDGNGKSSDRHFCFVCIGVV